MKLINTFLIIVLLNVTTINLFAQAIGDYQSATTGQWSTLTSWKRWSGAAWITPTAVQGVPSNTSGVITILSPHTITVAANATIDQVTINSGGSIVINAGITLTLANGTGNDLAVNGTLTVNGTLINTGTITSTGTIYFLSGSTYQHAEDGGIIPTATWDPASTCYINYTAATLTTVPIGAAGQSFGNFTWNAKIPAASLDFTGLATVNGNFLVSETGNTGVYGNTLRLQTALTVGGNFTTSGNTSLNLNNTTVARTFKIGGNFNAGGNFIFSNGTGLTTIDLTGSGKTITATTVNFFDFSLGPTSSNVEFHIINGASYTLNSNISVNGPKNDLIIDSGGTLYTGTFVVNNNRNGLSASGGIFNLTLGGTLGIGSPFGITLAGNATGNIQTATRNFDTGANYIYDGTAAQVTGTGLTQNVPSNITIVNPGFAVSLSANTIMSGILTVKASSILALLTFNLGASTAPSGVVLEAGAVTGSSITGTGTLTLGGDITVNDATTGTSGSTISVPIALGTASRNFIVANDGTSATDLTVSGVISSATFGINKTGAGTMLLSGSNTYTGLTLIKDGIVKLGATGGATNTPLGTAGSGTTVTSGAALDLNGFTLGTAEPLTLNGTGTAGEGALSNGSLTAVNYNGSIILGSASSIGTIGNIILGNGITGAQDLTKVGTATLNLGGKTATLGGLTISQGTFISTSGVLFLAGNFTDNAAFSNNNGTVTFNGSLKQIIQGIISATFNNFTMNNSFPVAALSLNIPTTISGILTLNDGHILTSSTNVLTLDATASVLLTAVVQDSSFVKGPMIQTFNSTASVTKIYPIGAGNIMHRANLTVKLTNTIVPEAYEGTFIFSSATALGYHLPSTLTKVSDIDYWSMEDIDEGITEGSENVGSASIQLYYFPMDMVTDPARLRIAKSDGSGNWLNEGGTGTATPLGNITSTVNFTDMGIFSLANGTGGSNPLPISLVSFNAVCNNNKIDVKWSTASEINNDFFTIEKSKDMVNWESVLKVAGAGNSNSILNYSVSIDQTESEMSYYRLKQTDFDGTSSNSDVVTLKCNSSQSLAIETAYYNQEENEIVLTFSTIKGDAIIYSLYDLNGRQIQTNSDSEVQAGINQILINTNGLGHGIYMLNIHNNENSVCQKVLLN